MKCRICSSTTEIFADAIVMLQHNVAYFRCTSCGFICTEEPYWLEAAYSAAITGSDLGLVNRNIHLSKITKSVISVFFTKNRRFIDYAGGYGLFVRLMRDLGFDFHWYDKYCRNLFACHFESAENDTAYELLTAFEVFEHLVDPINEVEKMLTYSRNILFTTEIVPVPAPKPDEWWYYGVEHGQHISFFTVQSLELIARKFSLNFVSDGRYCHLFTEKKIPRFFFRMVTCFRAAFIFDVLFSRKSLLPTDYLNIAK